MENFANLLADGLKDFRSAIDQGSKPSRSYAAKTQNVSFYNPEQARFKLVVWFKDGRSCWYYSYDSIHLQGSVHQDEWQGLKKLIRLAEVKFKGSYKNAIIYANVDPDKKSTGSYEYQVIKWGFSGNYQQNKCLNFTKSNRTKDILFDFERMTTFGEKKI